MKSIWAGFMERIRSYAPRVHELRPPCKQDRIDGAERELGDLPHALLQMLRYFNGAHLFDTGRGGHMISLFGISEEPPLPEFDWAPEWTIDKFTPAWRAAGVDRKDDWAIAMFNDGMLILLTGHNRIKKWETALREFAPGTMSLDEWLEEVFDEGEVYLKEAEQDAQQ
jgi:hypothetical protein